MLDAVPKFINEGFRTACVPPESMDKLWEAGWRHFGTHFFRYSLGFYGSEIRRVLPLRIRLADYRHSKSLRRTLRRNSSLRCTISPVNITERHSELFERHKQRFDQGVPDSIYNFISPAHPQPCETRQLDVYQDESLIASSFFDVGETAVSGIYAMFEPSEGTRSLGIFTLLKEIDLAIDRGMEFYYLGYAYDGESFYDYKKRFRGTEEFDWNGQWKELSQ